MKIRLPEAVEILHGPRDLLGRFFLAADQAARDRGITLWYRTDFEGALPIVEANRDSWYGLMPLFHPECSDMRAQRAFWIEGVTDAGEPVATQMARLFELDRTHFGQELESLRALYADPEPRRRLGETISVTAPSVTRLRGRVLYSGGGWYRPGGYRGIGLSTVLPRISRALGHALWGSAWTVSLAEPVLVEKGVVARYGYRAVEPMLDWRNRRPGDHLRYYVLTMDAGTMLADIEAWLAERVPADAAPRVA